MQRPYVFRNGDFLPQHDVGVPLSDAGLVLGASVTEQLRTFAGRLFHLHDHLQRLQHSLEIVGVDPGMRLGLLATAADRLVGLNLSHIDPRDDLGLCIFVTPGPYPALNDGRRGRPLVILHTYRLPFGLWDESYRRGAALAITEFRDVPAACWPADLKCRSRMHYYLADRAAAASHPGARALLLDADGHVKEASTANVVLYSKQHGLVAPRREKVLPGISLAVLYELADALGIDRTERDLVPADVATADEVWLTSTPFCLLPVTQFNGAPIGDGRPGERFQELIAAWSERIGVDIAAQAERFAARGR